jgi:hypothetical protein
MLMPLLSNGWAILCDAVLGLHQFKCSSHSRSDLALLSKAMSLFSCCIKFLHVNKSNVAALTSTGCFAVLWYARRCMCQLWQTCIRTCTIFKHQLTSSYPTGLYHACSSDRACQFAAAVSLDRHTFLPWSNRYDPWLCVCVCDCVFTNEDESVT